MAVGTNRSEVTPSTAPQVRQARLLRGRLFSARATASRVELANAMFDYLEIWHNRRRRHSQLGVLTPVEFERTNTITVA